MRLIILFTFFLSSIIAESQDFTKELSDKLDQQVEKYIQGVSPGVAVGIVKDNKIVYEKYIGYSNLENEIEISEDTRFNIASNAKQFTALCILKLIDQGKLNLEDDLRIFLPDIYKTIDDKLTISNLLMHTSGIRDVYDLWALKGQTWWQLFIDNSDAMDLLRSQTDLNFKPGTDYLYSNSNYILLTEIIKKITDEEFSLFAKSIFVELNMPNTSFLTNYMDVIPNKARPYGDWNGWREYPLITETHGDGALFTTLEDQLNWEKIIQLNGGQFLSKKLIDKSQRRIADSYTNDYGYGLMFGKYKEMEYIYHDGSTGAYNATFLRFVDKDLAIVVLSNNGNIPTNYLAKQLTDIILDLEDDLTEFPDMPNKIEKIKDLQSLVGNYKNDDGTIIQILEKDGSIFRKIYQRDPVKMIKEKDGLFHYETNDDLKMNFSNVGQGQQQFTIYLASQQPNTYFKLPESELKNYNKDELNGTYYNNETGTEILIEFLDNNTYSVIKNGRERKAVLILNDYLRMNSYEIKIIREDNGSVIGLNVNNNRIKNVLFKRI